MPTSSDIGQLGESIVAALLGFKRVPASGARWPNKEDLIRSLPGIATSRKELAQVKTTTGVEFFKEWGKLVNHAEAEGAKPRWFEVYILPGQKAMVFEKVLFDTVDFGVGGDIA